MTVSITSMPGLRSRTSNTTGCSRSCAGSRRQHPDLVAADSPTRRVGDQPISELEPVRHRRAMLSIDNTYSPEDLLAWGRRVEKLLGETDAERRSSGCSNSRSTAWRCR
jgi:hypothetical protein